jgi:hypothetical protein
VPEGTPEPVKPEVTEPVTAPPPPEPGPPPLEVPTPTTAESTKAAEDAAAQINAERQAFIEEIGGYAAGFTAAAQLELGQDPTSKPAVLMQKMAASSWMWIANRHLPADFGGEARYYVGAGMSTWTWYRGAMAARKRTAEGRPRPAPPGQGADAAPEAAAPAPAKEQAADDQGDEGFTLPGGLR